MHTSLRPALALLCLLSAVPARSAPPGGPAVPDDPGDKLGKIAKSAAGAGAEAAAKVLAGVLYDSSCKSGNPDPVTKYTCAVLGSVSGRAEDAWKAKIGQQLEKITKQLDTIEKKQNDMHRDLLTMHSVMEANFDSTAGQVVAAQNIVRIEGLWEKFKRQFDGVDADVTRDAMLSFAKDIIKNDLHTRLADLNVVLTKATLNGQPLLRYPFYVWRLKQNGAETFANAQRPFNANDIYDFGEKKFIEYRAQQQKAYALYLWAATVLESDCQLHPQQCQALPRSTAEIKADYAHYTAQQTETFNAAVDWLLLSCGREHMLGANFLPSSSMDVLSRANALTANMLGNGQGLWGRVISMGNKWDGKLTVKCGGKEQTLAPVFKYTTPVGGSGTASVGNDSGPFDWWVSTGGGPRYDEVRFDSDWRIYHYSLPDAAPGPCTIAETQPGGQFLPWVEPNIKVATATVNEQPVTIGSFIAIQRAGGVYAMASDAGWVTPNPVVRKEDGKGTRKNVAYQALLETNHPFAWVGVYQKGRAEYTVSQFSSRIKNEDELDAHSTKKIRFPDDSKVTLHFAPSHCGAGPLCGDPHSLLKYGIENNDTEDKRGNLTARVSFTFGPPDGTTAGGIIIDKSYEKASDKKTEDVKGDQVVTLKPNPSEAYPIVYRIRFKMETEGRFTNASEYMYQGLLAPAAVYLTK